MKRDKTILLMAAMILAGWLPLLMGLQVLSYDGSRITPGQATTFQGVVATVATLSACQGAPAVDARNYADLAALPDANCTIWEVPLGANYAQFDFQIDADANTATVQAWTAPHRYDPGSGANRDVLPDFTLAWSWALTGGKQVGPNSNFYCDTIVATEYWPAPGMVSDAAGDRICRYDVDLRGVKYVAFLRTDTDANLTVVVDERHY